MLLIKLTDADGYTRRGKPEETHWAEGVTVTANGKSTKLCTDQIVHAYRSPELAVFYNPIHASFPAPIAWEAEGKVVVGDGMKVGCKSLTCLRRVELPSLTTEQRVEIAIRMVLDEAESSAEWREWAGKWLSGEDRSAAAAGAAAAGAAAAGAAAASAERAAAEAAAEAAKWPGSSRPPAQLAAWATTGAAKSSSAAAFAAYMTAIIQRVAGAVPEETEG